jgi:phosphatidylglycerophosphate synthase
MDVRAQIPNVLSLARIPAALAFVLLFSASPIWYGLALVVALLALATDVVDGYLARRWRVVSHTGYFLDGLSDKAFYIAILLTISRENFAPIVLVWLLVGREVFLYALRSIDKLRIRHINGTRKLSYAYAIALRLFFAVFFVSSGLRAFGRAVPTYLEFGQIFGYLAAATGYWALFKLVREITQEA